MLPWNMVGIEDMTSTLRCVCVCVHGGNEKQTKIIMQSGDNKPTDTIRTLIHKCNFHHDRSNKRYFSLSLNADNIKLS